MNTERPEVLYHYTTMNALCNMLNGVTDRGDGQTPDYRSGYGYPAPTT